MEESKKIGQRNMRFLSLGKYCSALTEPKKDGASSHVMYLEDCSLTWHQRLEKCPLSLLIVEEY